MASPHPFVPSVLLSVLAWHSSQFTTVFGPTPSPWTPWTRYQITVKHYYNPTCPDSFTIPPPVIILSELFSSCHASPEFSFLFLLINWNIMWHVFLWLCVAFAPRLLQSLFLLNGTEEWLCVFWKHWTEPILALKPADAGDKNSFCSISSACDKVEASAGKTNSVFSLFHASTGCWLQVAPLDRACCAE